MLKALSAGFCAALLFSAADASCPNQCNGHGFCDNADRCNCFAQPGTKGSYRSAWTGADCSLRTCPYAVSHDFVSDLKQELLPVSSLVTGPADVAFLPAERAYSQHRLIAFTNNGMLLGRDTGVDVRVASVDLANSKLNFQYKLSFLPTYSAEVTVSLTQYSDRGRAYHIRPDTNGDNVAEDSGIFVYFDLRASDFVEGTRAVYTNDAYMFNVSHNEGIVQVASDANTAHPLVECGGRGACDRKTGECKCHAGYSGDGCQRTTCPNECSQHGTCMTLKNFVEEGTLNEPTWTEGYSATDANAQMGCKCDPGFRGADCSSVECPSGADPLGGEGGDAGRDCSSRGSCDYATGTCRCFKGFAGERCEIITAYM